MSEPVDPNGDALDRLVGDAETVREVFDAMPPYLVAFDGPDHVLVACNESFRSMFGAWEMVGLSLRAAFPDLAGQAIFEMYDSAYASGEAQTFREWRVQFRPGGTGELQEAFIDYTVTPVRGPDGRTVRLLAHANDVTDRVRERQAAQSRAAEAERRYQAARDVVVELQEALLTTTLPVLPGATVAARYLVAARDQAAGGDWFDAIPLPDGRLALVVGDVVGHGVAASAAMGQLRAVVEELLAQTGDLDVALTRADQLAARKPSMRAATLCVAVLDPGTGDLRYATCGHPAPLVVASDGAARYLPLSGAGPLGTSSTGLTAATATLEAEETLLLYTDGLVERPSRPLRDGMDLLAQVASDAAANRALPVGASASVVERVCQLSVELMTRTGYDDDVTVVAVQRRGTSIEPLQLELSTDEPAARLADIRARWALWLDPLDPTRHDRSVTDLAISELVANVAEHAYQGRPGPLRLAAHLGADGVLQIDIADQGTWREPTEPEPTSGRGLWMTGAVVDELHLDHDAGRVGTLATIRHRLRRPATLGSPAEPSSHTPTREPTVEFTATLEEGPPRTLRVSGALDSSAAAQFADRLGTASRGGVQALVVDLTRRRPARQRRGQRPVHRPGPAGDPRASPHDPRHVRQRARADP